MNVIFVSPHFPHTYWNFCARLKADGANVLGIGDAPYETLEQNLKNVLTEYYYVKDMRSYPDMFRAVAYFSFKYGKIDWLESNNEFWLEQDARLRTDFHITTGIGSDRIEDFKRKSAMKKFYHLAKVPTARQSKVTTLAEAQTFIAKVGYPVIVKPDVGVGASHTYKLSTEDEVKDFLEKKPEGSFVMEEFVTGDIYSYDAIFDSTGKPLFESSTIFPPSMMEIVNKQLDLVYTVLKSVPGQLRARGRATAKAFGVTSRFVHFEFFRLDKDKKGLGKKGDFVGLETNMRPAGGYTPDMMDWAHATDVYQIWADMVCFDELRKKPDGKDHYCVYVGRRDRFNYKHSSAEVKAKFASRIVMSERMPEAISNDLGNEFYIAHAYTKKELDDFVDFALSKY